VTWWSCRSAPGLRDQRVEHFADHPLLGFRQCLKAFELLLQFRRGPALGWLGVFRNERFDGDAERLRDDRQGRDLDAAAADLVSGDGLLRDAERFGELHLGDALFLAQVRDARAEPGEEGEFLLAESHESVRSGGDGHTVSPVSESGCKYYLA